MSRHSYVEREGRQFGLEVRVSVRWQQGAAPAANDPEVRPRLCASSFTLPVLRTRIWALLHGYGWPRVI